MQLEVCVYVTLIHSEESKLRTVYGHGRGALFINPQNEINVNNKFSSKELSVALTGLYSKMDEAGVKVQRSVL